MSCFPVPVSPRINTVDWLVRARYQCFENRFRPTPFRAIFVHVNNDDPQLGGDVRQKGYCAFLRGCRSPSSSSYRGKNRAHDAVGVALN